MAECCEVVVSGRVQGVYFRDRCRQRAIELGVRGWVRNEPDGTVRGHFEGPAQAVAQLIAWCRTGPPRAQVNDVRVESASATGATGFAVT
jgi:acylphosphatase